MQSRLQRGSRGPRRVRVGVAVVALATSATTGLIPRTTGAQSPAWELAGAVGAGFRAERGHTLGGARFEGALRRVPAGGLTTGTTIEVGAAIAQITAHHGPTGNGPNVKENSVELFVRAERAFLSSGTWRLDGSLAPVLSISMGCSAGGSFAGDRLGYGDAECTNAFANKATVRPGASARLTASTHGRRASVIGGVDATVGTVAAGNTVALGVFVGFRAPLSSR